VTETVMLSASNSQCLDNCINRVVYRISSVTSSADVWYVGDVFGLPSVRVMVEKKFVDSLINGGDYEGLLIVNILDGLH